MFGFPFQAEIIDDSIYYMGKEHALGHMAVELMNSIGDSDLLLHVTAARVPIEQALDAIKNYCFTNNPELKNMASSDEYTIYWNVTSNTANEIVVLYRSYTGAETLYVLSDTLYGCSIPT